MIIEPDTKRCAAKDDLLRTFCSFTAQGLGGWCVRRGCFYSCSGCFQLSGQQQKVDYIHLPDAVVVERWIWVECKKRLGVVVANGFERREFALERHFIADRKSNLKVAGFSVVKSNKINFLLPHYSDINVSITTAQFKIDDIFQKMPKVVAPIAKHYPSKAWVCNVIFGVGLEISTTFYVISIGFEDEKCLAKCIKESVECRVGYRYAVRFESADNFIDRERTSDIVMDKTRQTLEHRRISNAFSGNDVLVKNRVQYSRKIVSHRARSAWEKRCERKSAEAQIIVKRLFGGLLWKNALVFGERKWADFYFYISSCKKSGEFTGKKFSVGASDVNIAILFGEKTIHDFFKIGDELDFIEKNVCFAVCGKFASYVFPCSSIVRKSINFRIFEIDRDNVLLGNTVISQLFTEKFKKGCFSSTADARDNLYDVLVFPRSKPFKVIGSCDFCCYAHKNLSLIKVFGGMLAILRMCVKYDNYVKNRILGVIP